jgi:DNA-directed RNA polymerase specialized sigma24 family protein
MSSKARKVFDDWFVENYDGLVEQARRLHPDNRDLVHHAYVQCVNALKQNANILDNPAGYFNTTMWNLSANLFRKLYYIPESQDYTPVSDYDLADAIKKEEAMIMTNHLSWFDRTVLTLYLDGWSMAQLARESGIHPSVLYESISQSKKKLRHVIRQRTDQK